MAESIKRFSLLGCVLHCTIVLTAISLSACGSDAQSVSALPDAGGSASSSTSTVGSGSSSAASSAGATAVNKAPTIKGVPNNQIVAGAGYSFTPVGADANGDVLVFSISNLPAWAKFDSKTGRLTGTPSAADVGTYGNITIHVTDGKAKVSLAPFTLVVTQIASGAITLTWLPPTENTDGSTLSDLGGYKIHYGTSPDSLSQVVSVNSAGITSYVVGNLSPGQWYFALKSISRQGVESDLSAVVGAKI